MGDARTAAVGTFSTPSKALILAGTRGARGRPQLLLPAIVRAQPAVTRFAVSSRIAGPKGPAITDFRANRVAGPSACRLVPSSPRAAVDQPLQAGGLLAMAVTYGIGRLVGHSLG